MANAQAQEALKQHLRQAIDRLQQELENVEFWAEALRGFSQPIPSYEPDKIPFPVLSQRRATDTTFDYTRIGMRT
jgi:hypothetical protein